jgi:hypothetical protein
MKVNAFVACNQITKLSETINPSVRSRPLLPFGSLMLDGCIKADC